MAWCSSGPFAKVGHLENVRNHARGVNANRARPRSAVHSPMTKRQMVDVVGGLSEIDGLERPKRGVKFHFRGPTESGFRVPSGARSNRQWTRASCCGAWPELDQLGKAGHGSIFVHDFHDDPRGLAKPAKAREVHSGFGVARSTKDASGLGAQVGRCVPGLPNSCWCFVCGSMSAWMVLARSLAEMPVVHPCPIRSTETVNGVS